MKKTILLFIYLYHAFALSAQEKIDFSGTLSELFAIIQDKYGMKFMYSNDDIDDHQFVTFSSTVTDFEHLLKDIFWDSNISFRIKNKHVLLQKKDRSKKANILVSSIKVNPIPNNNLEDNKNIRLIPTQIPFRKDISILPPLVLKEDHADIINLTETDSLIYQLPEHFHKPKLWTYSLHSNLLFDMALMPNLGIECRRKQTLGIVLNGFWGHVNWDNGNKCYRLWSISPEIRYYFTHNKRFYTGGIFQLGELNIKFSKTGKQGSFFSGGAILGYLINLGYQFQLDFGIGAGYFHFKYDSYTYDEGVNTKNNSDTSNLFIPVKCGISLIWNIN